MDSYEEIGALFKDAREKKGVDIASAADSLRVRKEHLEDLENGKFQELESQVYLTGCIKSYANWLELNADEILEGYRNIKVPASLDKLSPTKPTYAFATEDDQKPGYRKAILLAVIAVLVFFLWSWLKDPFTHSSVYSQLDAMLKTYVEESAAADAEEPRDIASHTSDSSVGEVGEVAEQGNRPVFIVAIEAVVVTVNDITTNLSMGDTLFLTEGELKTVSADNPQSIEVYTNGADSQLIGTLNDIVSLEK